MCCQKIKVKLFDFLCGSVSEIYCLEIGKFKFVIFEKINDDLVSIFSTHMGTLKIITLLIDCHITDGFLFLLGIL